jgi:stage II sporulation protein D
MKYSILALIQLLILLCPPVIASEFIRVLMISSPYDRLPDSDAEAIDAVQGKIFLNGQFYSGNLEILSDGRGLYVVSTLPFEDYVEGVVASEVGGNWELEALKAQAVISRTYGQFYRDANNDSTYHLTSSVLHQVYKGENTLPRVRDAVVSTRGEILTYNNRPIRAVYHAACSGVTEHPEEVWSENYPYLVSVACNDGTSTPFGNWEVAFSLSEIASALGVPPLRDIFIAAFTSTGRVRTLALIPGDNNASSFEPYIAATDLRRSLGYEKLRSTMFSLIRRGTKVIFSGSGYGHAVGLSQWGALEMAKAGKEYRDILAHFYPGTKVSTGTVLERGDLASTETAAGNQSLNN